MLVERGYGATAARKFNTSSASHGGYFAYGTWHDESIDAGWLKGHVFCLLCHVCLE